MNTEYTYDDYLHNGEVLSVLAQDADTLERCPLCGEYCHHESFGEYNGRRMCLECVELEREEDAAESVRPNYDELFKPAI